MKYFRMLPLHLLMITQIRMKMFIYVLEVAILAGLMILYWTGAYVANARITNTWNYQTTVTYYIMAIFATSAIMSYVQDEIAIQDIQGGELVKYLVKPISYYWYKFFAELPYRIVMGTYAALLFIFSFVVLKIPLIYPTRPIDIFLTIVIVGVAHVLAFTFKMILGLLAFWLTEISALRDLMQISIDFFGGIMFPIVFFPKLLGTIAIPLPFSYMIYYPARALGGSLTTVELINLLGKEVLWVILLGLLYKVVWNRGIRAFTAVGQ